MNILAIETTGAKASVVLINNKNEIFEESSSESLNHLQNLMPMVGKVLEKSNLTTSDITAVAASEGPGSFTGIRIGVSSARALGQALKIKCIAVPTLPTFIYNENEYKGIVCPIFNARRSQVYGGAYKVGENSDCIEKVGENSAYIEKVRGGAYMLQEYLELLKSTINNTDKNTNKNTDNKTDEELLFFGDGVDAYRDEIVEWQASNLNENVKVCFAGENTRYQTATSVAKFALELYKKGEICEFGALEPNYMRKAEAEQKLEEAQKNRKG
ncbi:MAG: tRNA (adenosine(37)-N6)-threonylcarbamoyltransferase complex dimerization subunit type 1 TsaB [Aminipila sp.]